MDRETGHTDGAGTSIWSKPTSRRVVLKGAGLAGAAGLAGPFLRSTGARAATSTAGSFSPASDIALSYKPVNDGGYLMWPDYDGAQYQADIATAKTLGFKSVRVFLAARPGALDFPRPTPAELKNLTNLCNRAETVGIRLHINLFDFWIWTNPLGHVITAPYGRIADSKTWASAVIGALPNLANVACIEVKNEVKFASKETYPPSSKDTFDSGWPSGVPHYTQVGQVAQVWAQQMIPYIRDLTSGQVPVIISTTTDNRYFLGDPVADLAAFVKATGNTRAAPDWYDQHIYTGPTPGLIYSYLQEALSVVKGTGRPLIVGETGCTSAPTGTQGALQAQQQQADFLQACRWYCAKAGITDPSVWILSDLKPWPEHSSGQTFGLYDTGYKIKLAGRMYQRIPPGTTVPAIPINGTMRGGNQPDADGNALPPRWYLYKGDKKSQPITSAIDNASTYDGNPSVMLTYQNTQAGQTAPALMTNPITAPLTVPGDTYTWAAYLKASGSYGQSALAVSWYGTRSAYLGTTHGGQLKLTGSFAHYSVQSTAPHGALYAKLAITVRNGTDKPGHVWVANATWGQPT
jgi:hypothetical protein